MAETCITVLVLEDSAIIAFEIEDELAARGYRVLGAADLAQAWALATPDLPDAALLDWRLPDGTSDGLALHLEARGVRVLIASGADSGTIPAPCRHIARVTKPVPARVLVDRLDQLIGNFRHR